MPPTTGISPTALITTFIMNDIMPLPALSPTSVRISNALLIIVSIGLDRSDNISTLRFMIELINCCIFSFTSGVIRESICLVLSTNSLATLVRCIILGLPSHGIKLRTPFDANASALFARFNID